MALMKETFGSRLKRARETAKLSQDQLAAACKNRGGEGVTRSAVSYWESDKEKPSFDNLVAIAQKLNVSIDYLVGLVPDVKGISKEAIAFAQQWEALPPDAKIQVHDYLLWVRRMETAERKDYRAVINSIIKSSKIR